MSGLLRQFRKLGTAKGVGTTTGLQHPREAFFDPSESAQSHSSADDCSNRGTRTEGRIAKQRRWGRRRKRVEVVTRQSSSTTASAINEAKATPKTPPLTPEKEAFLVTGIPNTSSTATTTSLPSVSSNEKVPDGPFVPEEEVEAVQRALSGGDLSIEDDEDALNAVTHAVAALDKAGNDLFAAGEYDAAFKRYERALLLKRSTLQTQHQEHPAESTHYDRHPPQGKDGAKSQPQRADIVASVATSINNLTYLQQRAGLLSADDSLASYFKSLQMKRETLGPDHISVGKTLNNIGSVFYLKKEYEPALQAYRDARRVMETNLGTAQGDVGTVVSNIGDVYFALEKNEAALEHYRAALQIRWASLGPSDVKVARLMQRIAAIETGKQPERDGDDSESDTDEYQDGDLKTILFKEDIQTLQEEIEEDMKYFDLVEREMALSMLKDKMRIFREMRELSLEDSDTRLSSEKHSRLDAPAESATGANLGLARSRSEGSFDASATSIHRGYPKSCSKLSSEDRERALISVQSRLARMRADRNCVSESSGDDMRTLVDGNGLSNHSIKESLRTGSGSSVRRLVFSSRQGKGEA